MSGWLAKISNTPDDYTPVLEAYDHFDREYRVYVKELDVRGKRIYDISGRIPGLSEYVYAQWAELNAIVRYLNLRLDILTQKARKFYIESYPRELRTQQVEDFARAEPEVAALAELIITIELLLQKWEGISKGVERLHHQLRILSDMRKGGIEDATI